MKTIKLTAGIAIFLASSFATAAVASSTSTCNNKRTEAARIDCEYDKAQDDIRDQLDIFDSQYDAERNTVRASAEQQRDEIDQAWSSLDSDYDLQIEQLQSQVNDLRDQDDSDANDVQITVLQNQVNSLQKARSVVRRAKDAQKRLVSGAERYAKAQLDIAQLLQEFSLRGVTVPSWVNENLSCSATQFEATLNP